MSNPVIQAIMDRRSIRAYTAEPVAQETLDTLLECAINAPSAMNKQPWHLTVVKDRAWMAEMNLAIRAGILEANPNQQYREDYLYGAPVAVFVSSEGGKGVGDCGMLTENLLLAAQSLGLGTCVIGLVMFAFNGKDGAKFLSYLGLPEGHVPHYAIVIGHPAESPDAKEREEKITYVK